MPPDQMTHYAAALALEHAGKFDEAIAAWQGVAAGSDRRDQVRATIRGAELQLSAGRIGPGEAADITERQSYAWRGDGQELTLRLRAADLRGAAGDWRAALEFLRATDVLFPDQREAIRTHKTAVFEAMMATHGARLSPLDVVMLASDYADCVPDGGKDARLAGLLAEKLMALDLPARAIPVLQGLVKSTQPGPARAEFGMRLGQLLLDGGDGEAALTALQASDAPNLSTELKENRLLLTAKTQAALGHTREAAGSLDDIHSAAADDLRASLLGQVGDWKGSLDALSALAEKTLPSDGALSASAQSLIVREATAAIHSHDPGQLRRISGYLPRMTGASADMLRVLTETAITSTRELPRAATELKLARKIPEQIQSTAAH
jgi:tetratricopeptide (TPR) repeat protein